MHRREFLVASAGAAVLGAAERRARGAQAPATRPAAFAGLACEPVVMDVSDTAATVAWAVDGPATGRVEYGPSPQLGKVADGAEGGLRPLSDGPAAVRLEGLEPGKPCFYRVRAAGVDFTSAYKVRRGREVATDVRSFRTLDPAAASARLTVWNDTHENRQTLAALVERHRADPADLLVWNGDVTNDVEKEEKIVGQFLAPAGLAFASETPVLFGRGNHDVRGRHARSLGRYVPMLAGPTWRSFRQGPVACLIMDTGEDKPDDVPVYAGLNDFAALRTRQRAWLERAIEEESFKSAPFRIAFLHIPLVWEAEVPANWPGVWGQGIKGWICEDGYAKWHDLLVRGRVDLVISGHTHRHAYFAPTAKRPYGQLIGGGPAPAIATVIEASADARRLTVTMRDLAGKPLQELALDRGA